MIDGKPVRHKEPGYGKKNSITWFLFSWNCTVMQYCYFSLHFPPFTFFLFWFNMGYTYIFSPQLFLTSPVFESSFSTVASGIGLSWWLNTSRSSKELTTSTHTQTFWYIMVSFKALWQTFCVRLTFCLVVCLFTSCCISLTILICLCFSKKAENKGLTFDQLNFVM